MDALGKLQIIDFSHGIAAPIAGMFMADFGAEVVKIEPPDGDPARKLPGFAMWNRGKKSVVVDPAQRDQRVWLRQLLAGADICIIKDATTLEPFGLDSSELRKTNPRLIVLQVPPYAQTAPWHGGHESQGLLAAAAGVAWRQSSTDGAPIDSVYPHLLYVQGVWATVCAIAALIERERSGHGQTVTVTGINAVMESAVGTLTVNPDALDPSTAVGVGGRHPTYTRHISKDDVWIACGGLGGKFETRLLIALGLGDMLDDPRMAGNIANLVLAANLDWAKTKVAAAFRSRTADELMELIGGLGIPCGRMADLEHWLDHPQVKAIGMRAEVTDPEHGATVMPGIPINLTKTPGKVRGPAPRLGADTGKVTPRPAQPAPDTLAPMHPGPLTGYRIIDMGTFVAGPYAGSLLAELGAEVIKVEPLTGEPFRATGYTYNRGMRSLAIDLQNPAGRDAFYAAVKTADVVIDSLRPGVTKKLQIDYDRLTALKPDIITVSLSAYGEGGPLSQLPGVDMVLQAMSGMMLAQGGKDEPVANTTAIIDVTTAAMCVLCSVLGIYHREQTGEGQRAWDSLAATATYLQAGELVRYAGRTPMVRGSINHRGAAALDRFYAVSDGWIRIQAAAPDDVTASKLARAGLEVDPPAFARDPAAALTGVLQALPGDEAVRRLATAGVAATRARKVTEVLRDPQLLGDEFVHVRMSADNTPFVAPGRFATFSRTQRFGPMHVAGIGEHTVEVLSKAGMAAADITKAVDGGALVAGGPMEQRLMPSYR